MSIPVEEDRLELTVWVDDTPVNISVEGPGLEFEQALKALFIAGKEEVLLSLIEQAAASGEENDGEED